MDSDHEHKYTHSAPVPRGEIWGNARDGRQWPTDNKTRRHIHATGRSEANEKHEAALCPGREGADRESKQSIRTVWYTLGSKQTQI